ncbi:unnamed protein product [Medioppia subpectinata]|uniref:nicotinamidase n=1 Tax=Medioppia subpectinata TaxID=1979941 RepID=A0A7R9LB05_9ACAR|nr:unnamed protein product [Medioppia subpectinata]CAG2117385.1 unnamed protein product [Medioppia subpectinata]
MLSQAKSLLLAAIIAVFIYEYTSSEPSRFEFDLKHVDNDQRDRLFVFLDENKDKQLCKTEFKQLFSSLFYSSSEKTSHLVDEDIGVEILDLIFLHKDKPIDKNRFDEVWDEWIYKILVPKSALIVVDMQHDFIAGSMPVPNATTIVKPINDLMAHFETVIVTIDYHPWDHCSFVESVHNPAIDRPINDYFGKTRDTLTFNDRVNYTVHPNITQVLWKTHCVQGTPGADLYAGIHTKQVQDLVRVKKGMDSDIDSYSAFEDVGGLHKTNLNDELINRNITNIYLTGVLYEFCVGMTALDGLRYNYSTAFIEDAVHALTPALAEKMLKRLREHSASIITATNVDHMVTGYDRRPQMGYILARRAFGEK